MRSQIENNYRIYNPKETAFLLKDTIKKIGFYKFNPKKNRKERKRWQYQSLEFVKNPALLFSRFIPIAFNTKDKSQDDKENKQKYLELVQNEMKRFFSSDEMVKKILERRKRHIELLNYAGLCCNKFTASPQWRMIIGLGGGHPQETSMTLHHIYGIPYIPGSAIKGIARHWAESKNDPDLARVFGDETQEGNVIFMDAFPKDNIELKVDIMNPHYPDYYSNQKPPADYQSLKPIFFLTVGKNTKFTFYLLSKNRELLDKAIEWLKSALSNHGIGAKTAVGYGLFYERDL
jgi:CRISPR-associated protein Cmr6